MRLIALTFCATVIAWSVQAEEPFGLPAGFQWGDAPGAAADASGVERRGSELRIPLELSAAPLGDAYLFTAVYCDGHGLQQIRTATTRYHRGDVLRRFRRVLADLEAVFGPPTRGEPEIGTAYWGEHAALEAWPVSKAKFMVVLIRNGPEISQCALEGEA